MILPSTCSGGSSEAESSFSESARARFFVAAGLAFGFAVTVFFGAFGAVVFGAAAFLGTLGTLATGLALAF